MEVSLCGSGWLRRSWCGGSAFASDRRLAEEEEELGRRDIMDVDDVFWSWDAYMPLCSGRTRALAAAASLASRRVWAQATCG